MHVNNEGLGLYFKCSQCVPDEEQGKGKEGCPVIPAGL